MQKVIPKRFHSLIKFSQIVLDKPNSTITESEIDAVKNKMKDLLNSGLSPKDIQRLYNIEYTDFGMFLKKCLKLELLPISDSINNYYRKTGRSVTDKKLIYKSQCNFMFDPYKFTSIPGYLQLLSLGLYHPIKNPLGVCRDHMVSKEYGFRNNIPSNILSHPANCQFISNYDNIKKGESSVINIDQLMHRIANWGNTEQPIIQYCKKLPKTEEHRLKISESNKKYRSITNGTINKRILKIDEIPDGFHPGLTRK